MCTCYNFHPFVAREASTAFAGELGFGACTLRPQPSIIRFTVSSGRKMLQAAAAGGYAGVTPPIVQTAAAVNLDESDACTALALTSKSK